MKKQRIRAISNWPDDYSNKLSYSEALVKELERTQEVLKKNYYGGYDKSGKFSRGTIQRSIDELRKNPDAPIPPLFAGLVDRELLKDDREAGIEYFKKLAYDKLKILDIEIPTGSKNLKTIKHIAAELKYYSDRTSKSWAAFENIKKDFRNQLAKAIGVDAENLLRTKQDYQDFFRLWQLFPRSNEARAFTWEYKYKAYRDINYAIQESKNEESEFYGMSLGDLAGTLNDRWARGDFLIKEDLPSTGKKPEKKFWGGSNK